MHNAGQSRDPGALISTAEAASEHGVSVWTVARMVRAGDLQPEAKAPGRRGAYLFRRGHVDAAFAASESAVS